LLAGTILAPNAESLTPKSCHKAGGETKVDPTLGCASARECTLTEAGLTDA
jgi:hypothetical protein